MSDELTLSANGRDITGWEEIAVTLRAEAFPNSFEIGLSAIEPGTGTDLIVRPGDACIVKLGADTVVTGYVDRVANGGSAEAHALRVVGRGACQDLVDCSAEWNGGQIMEATAVDTITKLAARYGIHVRLALGAPAGPIVPQFNLTYGETAADITQRLARNAGLLAYEDEHGALVLARTGTVKAASGVAYGDNVERWAVELSMDGRYSDIVCTQNSQQIYADTGTAGFYFYHAEDKQVPRHRLLYMVLEQAAEAQKFTETKAKWEIARRAGRATAVSVTVDSWRDEDGKLWRPNTLVPVDLPGFPPSLSPLAISEVTFRRDESGTHADLSLLPPAAFAPEPISLTNLSINDIPAASQ